MVDGHLFLLVVKLLHLQSFHVRNLFFALLVILSGCDGDKKPVFYKLTVEVRPEGGGHVEAPVGPFEKGRRVTLKALPAEGYVFSGWSGDVSSSDNPMAITMSANLSLTATFEKKHYELKITVAGEGTVREDKARNAKLAGDYPHGTLVRLTAEPGDGWYFDHWEGDLEGVENPVELLVESARAVHAVFKEESPVDLFLADGNRNWFVSESRKLTIKARYASGREELVEPGDLEVTDIGGVGKVRLVEGNVLAVKSGGTGLNVTFKGLTKPVMLTVSAVEDVADYDVFLRTPASGAAMEVPVVVINYLPTLDGENLDMNRAPDDYWELKYSTLKEAKTRIQGELKITKFGIEEGTRYRQFSTTQGVNPYAGVRVVKYFNVYEMKMTDWRNYPGMKTPDYYDLFPKLDLENLVNLHGVKEVWITMFNKDNFPSVQASPFNDPSTYYGIPESNMASPYTGDISNSYRDPIDLPIYKKTYVVYGNSGHRGADTNLHNRGHQIEAQFFFIDQIRNLDGEGNWLFWNHFVGVPHRYEPPFGRVGMTHFPPNTRVDYDYDNPALVSSDIQNWRPEGGDFADVNNLLWKSRGYGFDLTNTFTLNGKPHQNDYSTDPHTKWLIYWWQAIPGPGNGLNQAGRALTNWWEVFYNWDDVIRALGGLVQKAADNARMNAADDVRYSPVCTHDRLPR